MGQSNLLGRLADVDATTRLDGQFGDYGLPPNQACFFTHAGVVCHYMREGAYYTAGGPGTIAKALVPAIEAAGGRVLVKAAVTDIVVAPPSNNSHYQRRRRQHGLRPRIIEGTGPHPIASPARSINRR